MKQNRRHKHYIESLPAAWLPKRSRWRQVAQSLPEGGCLVVTDPRKPEQARLFQSLTHSFRRQGREVVVWPVE